APDLNPTEGVWSLLKRSIANSAAADLRSLTRTTKRKLKKIQYRPELINGCLTKTGLPLESLTLRVNLSTRAQTSRCPASWPSPASPSATTTPGLHAPPRANGPTDGSRHQPRPTTWRPLPAHLAQTIEPSTPAISAAVDKED
ncbi:hypothetical protein ACFVRE_42325, partial [Streptomyces sp. NPDC057910]